MSAWPNIRILKYTKQKLIELKGEIDNLTIQAQTEHPSLTINRPNRQNVSKNIEDLNIINYLELVDIYEYGTQ